MIDQAEKYIDGVLSGSIHVSAITRMTFERHKRDLQVAPEKGWYFDKKAAQRVYDFCTLLHHSPDKRTWVPFSPEPWQAAIIYIIFGWKTAGGVRRFNYAYIEIPKKNGKTTFAAVFANYLLFFDGEQEAEVYCAASVEKQAKICFSMAQKMIEKSPALKKRSRILTKNVSIPAAGSKMEMLGRDSDNMEGINPSGAIIDEYHVWKNNEVFDNIQSATVNRAQPLVVIITTSGKDKTLPCFEYRALILDILRGMKQQDDTFGIIYTLDDADDWKDSAVWPKANPNYAVSVLPERFEQEFNGAINSTRKEVAFKTKNLNLWVDAPVVWIPDAKWMKCNHGTDVTKLKGLPCYWGIDLASHSDINALALFFPDVGGKKVALMYFWIPEEKAKQRGDQVDYMLWIQQGYIKTTPGDVIDIDIFVDDVLAILREYDSELLAFDPAKAYHGVIQGLAKGGFPVDKMDEYKQNMMSMTEPTKELERMVLSGDLDHLGNPVMRWMMGNVMLIEDSNGNAKPDKKRSRDKIDGPIALINAIGGWMSVEYGDAGNEIYRDHTLRFI